MALSAAEREARRRARRAFQARVRDILRSMDRLSDEAVRRALALLDQTRDQIAAELARVPAESFSALHLRGLRAGVDVAITELVRRYQADVPGLLERAHELGIDLAEEPFAAARVRPVPALMSRGVLEVLQGYSADLITALGNEARRRINGILSQAALGALGTHDAIRAIAGELPGPSVFKSMGARAEAIYRTEVNRAFSVAGQARMNQMAERLPGLKKMWLSAGDARVRPTHQDAHGQIVPARAKFVVGGHDARFPRDPALPAGESVNCFPGEVLVRASGLEAAYRRAYSGWLVSVRTATGLVLAGTPNHPVLTTAGWTPLGSLRKGDHVLGRLEDAVGVARPKPDVDHVPARIGELFDALARRRVPQRVRGSDVDFHGDGVPDSDVEVALADGVLERDLQASGPEVIGQDQLASSDAVGAVLIGASLGHRLGNTDPSGAAGSLSWGGEGLALLGSQAAHADRHRGRAVPRRRACRQKPAAHRATGDSPPPGKGLLRHAGLVLPTEIIEIGRRWFGGHVYNLQTGGGFYTANGIIVHNCRCHSIPVVPSADELVSMSVQVPGPTLG